MIKSDLREFSKAIEAFDKAIGVNKEVAKYYYYRGVCYFQKDEFEKAIDDFSGAILYDAKYSYAYNDRGSCKKKTGDLDGAMNDYEKAIQLDPKSAFAYNNLGSVKRNKKDYEDLEVKKAYEDLYEQLWEKVRGRQKEQKKLGQDNNVKNGILSDVFELVMEEMKYDGDFAEKAADKFEDQKINSLEIA